MKQPHKHEARVDAAAKARNSSQQRQAERTAEIAGQQAHLKREAQERRERREKRPKSP